MCVFDVYDVLLSPPPLFQYSLLPVTRSFLTVQLARVKPPKRPNDPLVNMFEFGILFVDEVSVSIHHTIVPYDLHKLCQTFI